jgi:hypothetical protein
MGWRLICRWPGFGTRWACTSPVSAVADSGLGVPSDVGHGARRHLHLRDPSGVADLGQPDSSGIGTKAAHCVLRPIEDPGRAAEELLLLTRPVTRLSSGVPAGGFGSVAPDPEVISMPTQDLKS